MADGNRVPDASEEALGDLSTRKDVDPFRIFISYSHADELFREALDKHLTPLLLLGQIEMWHDRHIQAGARLYEKIQSNIEGAHIILLLISADYLASKACQGEMAIALRKADDKTATAIPIVLRPCNWTILPIGSLLAANEDAKAISLQPDHDVAWTQVAKKIGDFINDWQAQLPPTVLEKDQVPPTAASEDQLTLKPATKNALQERWVFRREDNENAWEELKVELINNLVSVALEDSKSDVSLNIRPWGEKFIVDFTLPQHRNSRRLLIRDIGGYLGYPGYQLEIYAPDDAVQIDYSRVRWLSGSDGKRVLRQTLPVGGDMSTRECAEKIWREIAALAKP